MAFDYFFGNCQSQTGTIRLGSKKRFKDLLLRMQMNSMNGRTSFFILKLLICLLDGCISIISIDLAVFAGIDNQLVRYVDDVY
ncbi:MAG: hypothetical protein M0023_03875 [Desulfobacteraceae bacterium]|nr:hypothetical protein [Desulfobacteraceae bacterium]